MKLVCEGLDLSEAVLRVSKGTSNKTTNPILEGIKLVAEEDYLVLRATDEVLSIEKKIKADVKIEGETVVPGRFFSKYTRKLTNEQIELTLTDKNVLNIKYTDSLGTIQCLNPMEFPNQKEIDNENYFEIKKIDLKNLINKSIFAVAQDDIRPILKGCLIEVKGSQVKAVALDGFRIAVVARPVVAKTNDFRVTVPARSLSEISKLLDDSEDVVRVYVSKNYIMLDLEDTKISSRLLDGEFINYEQIFPTNFTTVVTINKSQLEDALDRAALLSRIDRNNLVRFEITDKVMLLTSKSEIGDIRENITIALHGNDLNISFNARYFTEAMRATTDEFIKINFTTPIAPCVITGTENSDYSYLILPVRSL